MDRFRVVEVMFFKELFDSQTNCSRHVVVDSHLILSTSCFYILKQEIFGLSTVLDATQVKLIVERIRSLDCDERLEKQVETEEGTHYLKL